MTQMIRCRQGHVFDASAHASCPVCSDTGPLGAETLTQSHKADNTNLRLAKPPASRLVLACAGAAVVTLGLAIGAWSVMHSAPTPDPVTHDPAKKKELKRTDDTAVQEREKANAGTSDKPRNGTHASDSKASDRRDEPATKDATLKLPPHERKDSAARPAQGYAEIAKLLGVSELVVNLTAFFTLKKQAGKQPSPGIIAAFEGLSKRGIAPASTELGNDYLNGRGVAQSDSAAIGYFKTAVEQRHPIARFVLAKIYQEGQLVPANPTAANALLALAVREGVPPALEVARNAKIDPSRFGMSSRELLDMSIKGNPKVVDAANGFIKDELATGYAALAYYAVEHSKDEALKAQAPDLAGNAARAGLDVGFRTLALIYASDAGTASNPTESAMWMALSLQVCGTPEVCGPTEANLAALKKKLDPSVVSYLDHIDEHLLKTSEESDPLLEYQR